ncbi:helix-turn-helix domain-containing protein [Pseudonocardia acaciae]|uniref:helix-turn-helix domain-containing protein n=1 Tax=Pseudonocardia acaciae TaxID=551276 RepID=UPI00048CDAAA|nr:helix-turn-helix domain-containing protein [Pseudonocardia acaciae]
MTAGSSPTVAELLFGGPLSGARVHTEEGLDRAVREVRIVDDLARLAHLAPGAAVVLTAGAVRGEWSVETAVRRAWEHAAACVVAPASAVRTGAPALIAGRLRMPLVTVADDPYQVALALARSVGDPSAARADVLARFATRLVELADPTPRAVLDALERTVPKVRFALLSRRDGLVAGHAEVARAADDEPDPDRLLRRPLPGDRRLELAALVSAGASGLAETVRVALGIAAPMLATALLSERLAAERDASVASAVLRWLLAGVSEGGGAAEPELAERAVAYGWPLSGPLVPVAVTTAAASDDAAELATEVPAGWRSEGGELLARHHDCWVCWLPADAGLDAVALVGDRLAALRAVAPLVGGVGPVCDSLAELAGGLASACGAAAFARHRGPGHVELAGTVEPAGLLAALPADALTGAARQAMARLLAQDRDGTLLRTLAALLDSGGAINEVADALGVHRNTVAGRARRLRELGLDPFELPDRLAVHLACHLLLRASI